MNVIMLRHDCHDDGSCRVSLYADTEAGLARAHHHAREIRESGHHGEYSPIKNLWGETIAAWEGGAVLRGDNFLSIIREPVLEGFTE